MGVPVTELAVQGDFCDGVPAVAKFASDASAMLMRNHRSVQVKKAKLSQHNGDIMSSYCKTLRRLTYKSVCRLKYASKYRCHYSSRPKSYLLALDGDKNYYRITGCEKCGLTTNDNFLENYCPSYRIRTYIHITSSFY